MTRAAAFILMILGLAASTYVWAQQDFRLHRGGRTELPHGAQLAAIELRAAGAMMSQAKGYIGTYSQTDLHMFYDLRIVRATETRFCVEVRKEGVLYHLAGPGGSPATGPCVSY